MTWVTKNSWATLYLSVVLTLLLLIACGTTAPPTAAPGSGDGTQPTAVAPAPTAAPAATTAPAAPVAETEAAPPAAGLQSDEGDT